MEFFKNTTKFLVSHESLIRLVQLLQFVGRGLEAYVFGILPVDYVKNIFSLLDYNYKEAMLKGR